MTYPNTAGHAAGSATSKAAAELVQRDPIADAVLGCLYRAQAHGHIVDEVKIMCERTLERDFDRSTIAARFTELKLAGLIEETDITRTTPRQRQATVYKITVKGRDAYLNR